jgi:hypothetical protein
MILSYFIDLAPFVGDQGLHFSFVLQVCDDRRLARLARTLPPSTESSKEHL